MLYYWASSNCFLLSVCFRLYFWPHILNFKLASVFIRQWLSSSVLKYLQLLDKFKFSVTVTHICLSNITLQKWNPEWNPGHFMVDYSEEEYQALQAVFPAAEKYLCAFHREQSWRRWVSNSKYHLVHGNVSLGPCFIILYLQMQKVILFNIKSAHNQWNVNLLILAPSYIICSSIPQTLEL